MATYINGNVDRSKLIVTIDIQAEDRDTCLELAERLKEFLTSEEIAVFEDSAYPHVSIRTNRLKMDIVEFKLGLGRPELVYFY